MPFIDLHCDTVSKMTGKKDRLYKNSMCVDIEKLATGNVMCQVFAMFINIANFANYDAAFEHMLDIYGVFCGEMKDNSQYIVHVRSAEEIETAAKQNRIAALLSVEEGGICNGKPERIKQLYDMGVRLITLTWNYENCIGYPNSDDPDVMERGLKPFGIEMLEQMQSLGMIVDVSHLSDGGFWDVFKYSKKTICGLPFQCQIAEKCETQSLR